MRVVTAIVSMAAIVLTAGGAAAQAKPDFAGEWKKEIGAGQGQPGVALVVKQDGTTMTVDDRRGVPAPVIITFTLENSRGRNTAAARGVAPASQVSRATWEGNTFVVITTGPGGEVRRTLSMDGDRLVVGTSAAGGGGRAASQVTATYRRYQRGYGG